MAVTTWHAPRIDVARPGLFAVVTVVAALLLGHWWAFSVVPGFTYSLWGPYFLGPLGWLAVAAVALLWFGALPAAETEHAIDRRTVCLIALLIGLFLVSLQIVGGVVAHFGKSPFDHSPRWLATNVLFAAAPLLAIETSRCVLLRCLTRANDTLALVGVTLFLAFIQFSYASVITAHSIAGVEFWAATFIPLASIGLVAGFFVLYGGVRASLLVTGPLTLFTYFSPFLLMADWPIKALVGVAGPAMAFWISESLFAAEGVVEDEPRGGFHLPSTAWLVTLVMGLAIFWFSFGFFGFRPAFIPTGSMEPSINRGDMVLIGPVSPGDIKVGDVVMYQANPQRVLHRVVAITTNKAGKREFTFKGDHNNTADPQAVTDKQIVGRYIGAVPGLGWVPIKFNQALHRLL